MTGANAENGRLRVRRRNTESAPKTETQCFQSRSQEKHRQNRSKPLTRTHAANHELAPATNPAPPSSQNAGIRGHSRTFAGLSGHTEFGGTHRPLGCLLVMDLSREAINPPQVVLKKTIPGDSIRAFQPHNCNCNVLRRNQAFVPERKYTHVSGLGWPICGKMASDGFVVAETAAHILRPGSISTPKPGPGGSAKAPWVTRSLTGPNG
jgi:hypothetical protein